MSGAQAIARLLNFLLIAAVARLLGSEGAGGYATAVSVALGFLLLTDLGLSPRLIREASARPEDSVKLYREVLGLKVLLMPFGLGAIAVAWLTLPYTDEVHHLLVLTGLGALFQSVSQANEALLRSREEMHWEALGSLVQSALTASLGVAFLTGGLGLIWVGVARLAGALVNFALTSMVLRIEFRPRLPSSSSWRELRDALPYAATASMNLAYGQIDVLLLSLIAPQALVGEYALVSRLVLVAGTFASTGAAALLPSMARTFSSAAWQVFRVRVRTILGLSVLVGGLSSAFLAWSGGPILAFAYGPEFAHLTGPFAVASSYVFMRFVTATLGMELTAAGFQTARARCIVIGLLATVLFLLACVPVWGVVGAIAALVGSEFVLAGCLAVVTRPLFSARDPRSVPPTA